MVCCQRGVQWLIDGLPRAAKRRGKRNTALAAKRSYAVSAIDCVGSPKMKPYRRNPRNDTNNVSMPI